MPRQVLAQEVNKLVAGLITEASPLTFPENASIDEQNFVLNKTGLRSRRLGMDLEVGFTTQNVTELVPLTKETVSTFVWSNAGSDPDRKILVVQRGTHLLFYDMSITPLSAGFIHEQALSPAFFNGSQEFSFTVVDATLLVATKSFSMITFDYESTFPGIVTLGSYNLKMRDTFGVEDGLAVDERTQSLTNAHLYNLRNQGWAVPRLVRKPTVLGGNDDILDPIPWFRETFSDRTLNPSPGFPSHSDNISTAIFPDLTEADDDSLPPLDKFWRDNLILSTPIPNESPLGHFIIDVALRGQSRLAEEADLRATYPELTEALTGLPEDASGPGPSCVGEFAGRAWYGGFSGEVTDGDENSPNLTSYIFFSQLVSDPTKLGKCYQEGNPTDPETAELLATDGGFLRLDGAHNIKTFVNIGTGLVVLADNGVWVVQGGNSFGFDATNILVDKITTHGCMGISTAVEVDSTVMYWSEDGIYHIAPNEFGELSTKSLTTETIQTFYDGISSSDLDNAQGVYDASERKVRWVYGNSSTSEANKELVLDLALGAFYPNVFTRITGTDDQPRVLSLFRTDPFIVGTQSNDVQDGVDVVVFGGEQVTFDQNINIDSTSTVKYLIESEADELTFGEYTSTNFKDWKSSVQFAIFEGLDAEAFMLTGWGPGGDFQRKKQATWITFHFLKTETGFELDPLDEFTLIPVNPGSCLVQAQWDWSNDANSNRFGVEFEAYRHKRLYIPADINDNFDDGEFVLSTKNKIRGMGKVLSLKIRSKQEHDLQFLGMSTILEVNGNV